MFNKKDKKKELITPEEHADWIKDEVYAIWPRQELRVLLDKYNTDLETANLPENISQEDLERIYVLVLDMISRYGKTVRDIFCDIRDKELDCDMVLHNKYVKKLKTRREALVIDKILQYLEKYESEEVEAFEIPENLSREHVEKILKGLYYNLSLGSLDISRGIYYAKLKKCREAYQNLMRRKGR